MYKSKNELAPEYLSNLLFLQITRSRTILDFHHHPYTELYKSSFSFNGLKVWNLLPNEIKTSKTVFEFKNSYKLLNF